MSEPLKLLEVGVDIATYHFTVTLNMGPERDPVRWGQKAAHLADFLHALAERCDKQQFPFDEASRRLSEVRA